MVDLVKDWRMLEEYAEGCRVGAFQVREVVEGWEVRVHVGRFGFVKTFKDEKDGELAHIRKFCEKAGFVEITGSVDDSLFFR